MWAKRWIGIKCRRGAIEIAEDLFLHASRNGALNDLFGGQPGVSKKRVESSHQVAAANAKPRGLVLSELE